MSPVAATASPAAHRLGAASIWFERSRLSRAYTFVGPREGDGPLGRYFDETASDYMLGETRAEMAERRYLLTAMHGVLARASLQPADIDLFLAGDLLNQTISSSFAARSLAIPFMGLFNACATIAEALILAAMAVEGGFASRAAAAVSSHYQTAERQYRYPIELNIQRKATNHWTVTGGAAALVDAGDAGVRITHATIGRVRDYGLHDPNDMGSAMAPAAADTLLRHLADLDRTPGDYDLILTGDLGAYGSKMFHHLVKEAGWTLGGKHMDAGAAIFSPQQQAGAGGSGCACSAAVLLGYVLKEMQNTRYHRVLAIPTGSLHSPTSWQQGETIPCIAHAVVLETA